MWFTMLSANSSRKMEYNNITVYNLRMETARELLKLLDEIGVLYTHNRTGEERAQVYNSAIVKLLGSSNDSMSRFLSGSDRISFRHPKRAAGGKLISVEAYWSDLAKVAVL